MMDPIKHDKRKIESGNACRFAVLLLCASCLLCGCDNEREEEPRTQSVAQQNDPAQWIKNLDVNQVAKQLTALEGNAKQGRGLFISATCITCHLGVPVEDPIAPTLVGIAERQTREQLVDSILHPSRKIVEGYVATKLALLDGKVVSGVLVEETDKVIKLRMTTGQIEEYPVANIEERMKDDISPMPTGLLGTLSVEQGADILAYVESL